MAWAITLKAYISEDDFDNKDVALLALRDGLEEVTSNYNIGFCECDEIHEVVE